MSSGRGEEKMKLIKPSHEILFIPPKPLETIEAAERTCYKSEKEITENNIKMESGDDNPNKSKLV